MYLNFLARYGRTQVPLLPAPGTFVRKFSEWQCHEKAQRQSFFITNRLAEGQRQVFSPNEVLNLATKFSCTGTCCTRPAGTGVPGGRTVLVTGLFPRDLGEACKPVCHSIFEFWLIPDHFSGPVEAAEHDAGWSQPEKRVWNFDPIVTDFFFLRSRLRLPRIRIQKTCRSDFSPSASAESGKSNDKRRFCAAESALKLVDHSRIGQIPVKSSSELRRSTNWKFEKTREFSYFCICTQFSRK